MERKISTLKDDLWDALKAFERKIAEFDATFACIPDGAIIFSMEGAIVAINEAALNILGISKSEVSHIPLGVWNMEFHMQSPSGSPISQKQMPFYRSMQDGDKIAGSQLIIINRKGKKKILSVSTSPIFDERNKVIVGIVAIFIDLTLQETLNSILRVTLNSETMRELLQKSADIISTNFNIPMLCIYLYDEDTGTLRARASKGLKKDMLKIVGIQHVNDASRGIAAASVRERRTINSKEGFMPMGAEELDERLNIRSVIAIPLIAGNEIQGAITMIKADVGDLAREDIDMLETVCSQLAMSISKIRGAEDERIFREVLSRRTAELNAIISQMVDGVLVVDAEGKVIMQNQALRDMMGYSYVDYAKLYRKHKGLWLGAMEPRYLDNEQVMPDDYPFAQAIMGKTVSGMIFRVKTKYGTGRILSISSTPLVGDDHKMQGSIAVLRDVTLSATLSDISEVIIRSATLNEMLKGSLEVIMNNLNLVTAGIYQYDELSKTINMAVYRGYSDEALGVFGNQKVSEKSRGIAGQSAFWRKPIFIDNIFDDPKTKKYSLEVAKKLGIYSLLSIPVVSGDELHGVLIVTASQYDILSEDTKNFIKIISNQLASGIKKIKADENERMARLDAEEARDSAEIYLDVMSHDIINANQISLGYLELLESSPNLADNDRTLIKNSLKALRQSTRIIENIKKIMRVGGYISLDRMDLKDVLEQCISSMPSDFKKTRIECNVESGLCVLADNSIYDIFINLLDNSLKFSGDEVHILICADSVSRGGDHYYHISVEDNGIGVPDEIKHTIFQRFRSTGYKEKGRGLGLYLARSIIELYGGEIWVEDRVKGDSRQGAKFHVLVPHAE